MRAPSALAIAMAGMALLAALFFRHMPYPYDDVVAVEIPPERIALMPGGANGSRIPPPFQGPYAPNKRLKGAIRLFEKEVVGSECVAVTAQGDLIMLDQQGYVFRASPVKGSLTYQMTGQRFYVGPGRPLGFHVSGKWLYVCCSLKGLLRLHLDTGAIEILSNAVLNPVMGGGASHLLRPVTYANDLDVAADGSVYFTSSASRTITHTTKGDFYDTMRGYLLSNAYGEADGRLLVFHPASRRTTLVLDGLAFPNGVALSKDESWIAVVETSYARVLRHWLKGPRAGETEVLLDGLPGALAREFTRVGLAVQSRICCGRRRWPPPALCPTTREPRAE